MSELALARLLAGGDLRAIGAADQAARQLVAGEWHPASFLLLLETAAPVIRMRAADALEKATRRLPELIANDGVRLLAMLEQNQAKEVRWHLLQMAPRVHWAASEQESLLAAIEQAFADKSAIVQCSALQALAELSVQAPLFAAAFQKHVVLAANSPLASLRARARKLAASSKWP